VDSEWRNGDDVRDLWAQIIPVGKNPHTTDDSITDPFARVVTSRQ